ncbi:MAG: GNAT family N-acetyltransferase [Chromatiaceae bacterium]|nr:GNAT family N-acetyltransferase [Chromatiaceae bacterium]
MTTGTSSIGGIAIKSGPTKKVPVWVGSGNMVKIKIACCKEDMDRILWLRHKVYVEEEGRYGGALPPNKHIMDRFDWIPKVAHILIEDDDEPVGCIRMNAETGFGLPINEHFDYRPYLEGMISQQFRMTGRTPLMASAGMLAVRRRWRRKREVTRELYRATAIVLQSWQVSHVIALVSLQTASLYDRMGFLPIAGRIWLPDVQDHVIPIMADAQDCYDCAFSKHANLIATPVRSERLHPARLERYSPQEVRAKLG